ncbi:hypothetical protein K504DRAFT_463409 [Pleomassaria siparia CBS 279.74]|uniref:Ribosome biogenesis protein Urb1 n=1 Tax=Pleomassaria siparia CBS 279.74 TaxID=1314801 RepID=A0A6G1JU42_9PLEO|nr:hypothetical protein K504DRAFT_463409 [Pleomassaria siparia CBS 279.74]
MGKRTASEATGRAAPDAPHVKRQRVERPEGDRDRASPPAVEEVSSARQLQKALVFDRGTAETFRTGLFMLKKFLDSILYSTDDDDLPRKRAILREYLDLQRPNKPNGQEDHESPFLPHHIQAWDFAAVSNYDALLAQTTAGLALLVKVFSSHTDFVEYGALLCKTILQSTVARRLGRSLSASPSQDNIISPVLRLLTELTRFNEGAHARAIYAKRDFTLEPKILGRNIGLWTDPKGKAVVDLQRKPSVRVNAVRYFLTHLQYLDEVAKIELLSNRNIVRSVFDHLHADPPFLIFEILNILRIHVFQDKTIPRQVKSRILTGRTLSHIAGLYRYLPAEGSIPEGHKAPDEVAHEFLKLVCTSPAYGVMLPTNGLYPMANDDEGDAGMEDAAEFALDFGIDPSETLEGKGPVRNVILGEFTQSLKPYANILQQELVVAIFKSCPELVAHYFLHKETFNYEPKLTSTWVGFSSFLYETIELPVPTYFGAKRGYRDYPPAISTLIQSILPQPLTQQVLTKCLNQSSDLVNLFAVRVLIVAFHKLRAVLREFNSASRYKSSKSWEQASKRLVTEFCQRCPLVKTVILAFRRPAFQKDNMRESITRLLRLYYEIAPQVALQEKFDISVPLCNALTQAEKVTGSAEDRAFRVMELEHWIQIARNSPAMRWWQKTKPLPHSPFVMLLKLIALSPEGKLYSGIKPLLVAVLRDHDMLQMTTSPDGLDALISSLGAPCGSSSPSTQVLEFLDECCARFMKGSIKYFDDKDALVAKALQPESALGPLSPLLLTFVEQWPFKGGKVDKGNPSESLAQWLSKLLYLLKLVGEDESLLILVRDALVTAAAPAYQEVLKDAFLWKMGKEKAKAALKLATGADFSGSERSSKSPIPVEQPNVQNNTAPAVDLEMPPKEDDKHAGLGRWRKKDIEESLENGDIGELLLCLCSEHAEIRLQAVQNIRQLMAKITTDDADLLQLKLLLGEALETVQHTIGSNAMPYVGGVFAARAALVLADPMHFMFAKINQFLLKRPDWIVENLPRYLGKTIINSEPDQDGAYHKEVDWFLDYLIDCLRTEEDMEIFRTNNVIEKLLSYYVSASCAISAKEKIVRLLLRAAAVGGSTTLMTRCGLVSWIQMRLENNDHRHRMLRALALRIHETSDQGKVEQWSSGTTAGTVAALAKVGA